MMQQGKIFSINFLLTIIFCIFLGSSTSASLRQRSDINFLGVHSQIIDFEPSYSFSYREEGPYKVDLTGVVSFLTYQSNRWSKTSLIIEIPIIGALSKTPNEYFKKTDFLVPGNPYLGILYKPNPNERTYSEFGITLPITNSNNVQLLEPISTALPTKFELFAPESMSATLSNNICLFDNSNRYLSTKFGLMLFVQRFSNRLVSRKESDFYFDYALKYGQQFSNHELVADFDGRIWLDHEGNDIETLADHIAGLRYFYKAGKNRYSLFVEYPIDKSLRDIISISYGLSIQINI